MSNEQQRILFHLVFFSLIRLSHCICHDEWMSVFFDEMNAHNLNIIRFRRFELFWWCVHCAATRRKSPQKWYLDILTCMKMCATRAIFALFDCRRRRRFSTTFSSNLHIYCYLFIPDFCRFISSLLTFYVIKLFSMSKLSILRFAHTYTNVKPIWKRIANANWMACNCWRYEN